MPSFFPFTPGQESRARFQPESSPLLGRFRAVPPSTARRPSHGALGLLSSALGNGRGSVHVGYGAVLAAGLDDDDDDDDDVQAALDNAHNEGRGWWRRLWRKTVDVWIEPKQGAVRRVVDVWWSRYGVLVVLPAVLAIGWCALPFPQYPLLDDGDGNDHHGGDGVPSDAPTRKTPGHGQPRVRVNFWFFLFVYYNFYNLTALIWITKVFNLYSLNWWPQSLGFLPTVSLIATLALVLPIPIYLRPETRFLTVHNTSWIAWTFIVMAAPVAIAFLILTTSQRHHLGLRNRMSDTQRIFTTSWWTGGDLGGATPPRRVLAGPAPDARGSQQGPPRAQTQQRQHQQPLLPVCEPLASRQLCALRLVLSRAPRRPHGTIMYVYSWVVTVHLLDLLTGWLLGIREGERVGSYPLSWIFKLQLTERPRSYFMLTYQTYVRALYARLRSPQQFVLLQVLSSSFLILLTPLTMSPLWHRVSRALNFTDQSYASYQKVCTRNVFIRFLAENVSMAAFLGSVLVLHFGANKDVYPYFAFDFDDDDSERYDFRLTFWASSVTWACELAASLCLRLLIRWCYGVDVGREGRLDLAVWPELLPTSVAVMLHVLQNMLFSIIRLQFQLQ
ncbi:conserved hypothetical protein [Verticillium alfalfae VaMs.102]|uniref:Uncharacterized protein n=1 Tax=Verticillium alfalfae (strain VaMs.102 / ATCC MYA-4576 / FGSC 10136) TaxID=526221 RepID=C9SQZ1_VERA1|nr:conserved hypothetical protein [Verticillium alfalfae VaMs.102]EEY21266.1 conserved hypothetical protein [Verticillium alfalfae VaMs.102]